MFAVGHVFELCLSMKRLAVVTMVFNESINLPRWVKYYSGQVDRVSDLYILDHGSNDCSTAFLDKEINLARLPRGLGREDFEVWRLNYVSGLTRYLKDFYRAVVYVDCDEFLVVDPMVSRSLAEYFLRLGSNAMTSAIGYNILHEFNSEPAIRFGDKITESRSFLQLNTSMCKAVAVVSGSGSGSDFNWSCGFHFSSLFPRFGDLFLFHTRYADLKAGLKRLSLTRGICDQPRLMLASHQRISDETYVQWLKDMLSHSVDSGDISMSNSRVKSFFSELPIELGKDGLWTFPLDLTLPMVSVLPDRFVGLF